MCLRTLALLGRALLWCFDAFTGDLVYRQITENSASYASPMIVNDKLYLFCGETTYIVQVGWEYKLLGTNVLEEYSDVNSAVVDGRLYIRGEKHLHCIGNKP